MKRLSKISWISLTVGIGGLIFAIVQTVALETVQDRYDEQLKRANLLATDCVEYKTKSENKEKDLIELQKQLELANLAAEQRRQLLLDCQQK